MAKQVTIYQVAAHAGVSRATVYRHMRAMSVQPARRQRADAGTTSVTREEALAVSELLMAAMRKNNKRLMTVADALQVLRYDGSVRCERLDPATGESEVLTTHLPDLPLLPDEAVVKDWSEHSGLARALAEAGVVELLDAIAVGPFAATAHRVRVLTAGDAA